ncbi:MAG: peptide ABC transporter permease [Bdellovibrionaceae bacterium]|nr:peptide ABC transporter permease [Pseudobdellovibrionaceae bacterium]|tara:strand:- start:825 stop:1760 length:936 start_codon:yes stop_codon:yes gene_type:complete
MTAYILKRIIYTVPIVFGVALIMFSLFHLVGGDPTYQMLGKHADAKMIADLRSELGLDQSYFNQFLLYLKQIMTFDFGRSFSTRQKISEMILSGLTPSFSLALLGFCLTLVLSLVIAMISAYFRGKVIDKVVVVFCVLGMSISALAYILFGQYFLAYKMGWFPISGYESEMPYRLQYLIMPALIWVAVSVGVDVRFFRTALLDEVYQDYVRTARAKGLSDFFVFFKHVLKNSLIPIITYLVIQIPFLMLGSFLLESFFGIPGIGNMTIDAINNSDFPVLKAIATVMSLMVIFFNLLTDLLYTVVDPRVRLK